MDNLIYDFLIKKEYNQQSFLDCILILSINGLYISYDGLLDYCNNFRLIENKTVNKEAISYYGLNYNQYQLLDEFTRLLKLKNKTTDCKNKIINTHNSLNKCCGNNKFDYSILIIIENNNNIINKDYQFNNNNKNSNNNIYNNNNDNNNSIIEEKDLNKIITLKNERINGNDGEITTTTTTTTTSRSSTTIMTTTTTTNGVNDRNYLLFRQVWRNIVIKTQILFHLRLYNIHANKKVFLTPIQLVDYKFKGYLQSMVLNYHDDNDDDADEDSYDSDIDDDDSYSDGGNCSSSSSGSSDIGSSSNSINNGISNSSSSSILSNSSLLELSMIRVNSLPEGLKSIEFEKEYNVIQDRLLPPSISSIRFSYGFNQRIAKGVISDNVISITFGDSFNQSLDGNWLPKQLKHLQFGHKFQQTIKMGQLPSSLTSLILDPRSYKGVIEIGSIPDSVKTLDYKFNSCSNQESISFNPIPKSITRLVFDSEFNQNIKANDISSNYNLTSIHFGEHFNSDIGIKSLPNSIREIKFGRAFDRDIKLCPSSITSIDFGNKFNRPLSMMTQTLTSIDFGSKFNQIIPQGIFIHTKLKSLNFGYHFNQIIPADTLPPTLESLNLGGYNREITVKNDEYDCYGISNKGGFGSNSSSNFCVGGTNNGLREMLKNTTSLKTLTLNYFNRKIEVGDLPNSIESLNLGYHFNQPIGNNVLPKLLKKLFILNSEFNQNISADGCIPFGLQTIYIRNSNMNFINSLNPLFITKYINIIDLSHL
ncbi:hypothetical protein DDB_G0277387 [Dictyostelium discoideum AX4]|uniref:FNIP repeat-containing protein n=1 Tax=Dictyostelium discoideum TaxID=44689 RepID=Q75J89_DICDI|nr:hypothetical protein DDB_G0277387 [Dictyostelium discoideum AX4]EAL68750.1 hypothetical protein DDB_G0277387 [Dictyostelium discoideum AX4]|eukprot:XP_642677.1 hypothetical protein DDB_G0277387 [Dictyostelium discoideum AX4]